MSELTIPFEVCCSTCNEPLVVARVTEGPLFPRMPVILVEPCERCIEHMADKKIEAGWEEANREKIERMKGLLLDATAVATALLEEE